jgi:NADH-quinone oxidoreductase subunit E
MLSEKERSEIEEELKHLPHKSAACIEALRVVQKYRHWVSDEAIHDIAGILEMTAEEVDSVATFYNLVFRKPVGKHIILICDSISCWVMGYDNIRQHISERLGIDPGETTTDGLFTFLTIPCLGNCDRAPSMMVDDELFSDLTPDKIDSILAKYS